MRMCCSCSSVRLVSVMSSAQEAAQNAETVREVQELICTHTLAWPCMACHDMAADIVRIVLDALQNDGQGAT